LASIIVAIGIAITMFVFGYVRGIKRGRKEEYDKITTILKMDFEELQKSFQASNLRLRKALKNV